MSTIFVPSKNRAKTATLLLKNSDEAFIIVVEPQDYEAYTEAFPGMNYMMLPKNDQGISYVRNYIREYAETCLKSYWVLDDDITQFYHRDGTKMIKDDISVLAKAEEEFIFQEVALAALEYQQLAWSATKPFVFNSFCDVCVWVDVEKTRGIRYREYLEGKEDRDLAMQVIKSGQQTARTTLYAFAAPANGSNSGGLKESFYDTGKELQCVDRMVETWGMNICEPIIKKNGRRDVKIHWKEITNKQPQMF